MTRWYKILFHAFMVLSSLPGAVHAAKPATAVYAQTAETATQFKIRQVDHSNYPGLKLSGSVKAAVSWSDKRGLNLLVLTEIKPFKSGNQNKCTLGESPCSDAELYAYHYLVKGNDTKLLRRVRDMQRNCGADLYAKFLKHSLTVTDLDGNGIAEITFAYKKTCTSDVAPTTMKLIMLEDNKKYALRGMSFGAALAKSLRRAVAEKNMSEKEYNKLKNEGDSYKADKAYRAAPRAFLEFSKKRWSALKVQNIWDLD